MARNRVERLKVLIPYEPRDQFAEFHERKQRWACLVAHRRAGKTVACINDLIKEAMRCTKPDPRFAYVAPLYTQAKDVAWQYLKRYSLVIPEAEANESELRVDLPGGRRIRLYGAENYDRLRGIYLDGVVLDEYADMDPRAWSEVIRPALSDRQGWAVFIGTPKGRNSFFEIMHGSEQWPGAVNSPDWYALTLRASQTGIVAPEELADARRMMTPEQYAQEYECSFEAAIQGAYYGREIDELGKLGRIRAVTWEPTVPVTTAWDLGLNDATAIWFVQVVGNEIRVIDHYNVSNQSLIETAKVVLGKPYLYKEHLLPHDVEVRELISAKTRREVLESLGLKNVRPGKALPIEEGINAVKMLLPKCLFNLSTTKNGLEALRHYRSEFDEKRKVFKPTPLHDWSSHDADAFKELAVNLSMLTRYTIARPKLGTIA